MNITLISRKYVNLSKCFLTYKTDIPVTTGYEKAKNTILLFADLFMKDIVDYSYGNFPYLENMVFNHKTGFIEFTVVKRYVNSEYAVIADTACKDGKHFLVGMLSKDTEEGNSETSDKLIDITHEEYNRLNFWW